MSVSIRRIAVEEWPVLRDVRLRSLLDSPGAFGQQYTDAAATADDDWISTARASSAGSRRAWFIAWNEAGEPLGVVQARRRPPVDCLVFSMWVAPAARRLGVGAALIDTVEVWSRSWGAERIILWVIAGNESATRFYDRIGFRLLNDGPDAESGRAYGAFAMERKGGTPAG